MLECLSRYRNATLGLFVEPGEVLRDLSSDLEAWLQRDAPGAFRAVKQSKLPDAPDRDKMMAREDVTRKANQSGGEIMTRDNMQGIVRPKG